MLIDIICHARIAFSGAICIVQYLINRKSLPFCHSCRLCVSECHSVAGYWFVLPDVQCGSLFAGKASEQSSYDS